MHPVKQDASCGILSNRMHPAASCEILFEHPVASRPQIILFRRHLDKNLLTNILYIYLLLTTPNTANVIYSI
jgi:hypothetical protein